MTASKQRLEAVVGRSVSSFAYPGCAYSPACPEAAREAGYAVAVTCAPQGGWYPLELTRESVDRLDHRLTFALKARGIFEGPYASPPGRAVRRLIRPWRHRGAR